MEEEDITIPWTGYYVQYGVENEMIFDSMIVATNGTITGRGGDVTGEFQIQGSISSNGFFQFNKQYIGQHSVLYQGSVTNGCLSGTWSIDGLKDEFVLNLDTENWKGSFMLDGKTYPMLTNICVSEEGVFGLGKDAEGVFVINGNYDDDQSRIYFVKSYLGRYNISYDGSMFDDGQFLVVSGQWTLSTGQQGTFNMYQKLEGINVEYQQFYHAPPPPQQYVPVFYGMPPQMIPPQYNAVMSQGQQGGNQQFGYLDDIDFYGGDHDDVAKIIDKILRGKKIKGSQIRSFLPMIRNQNDMEAFCKILTPSNVEKLEMDDLVEGLSRAKNQDYNVRAVIYLYPLLSTKPQALENQKLEKLFVFSKDKKEVEKALKIDI